MHVYIHIIIGVTEMRIREYNKAKKRFIKTLQLQSDYTIAKTNLVLLQKLMSNEDYNKGI